MGHLLRETNEAIGNLTTALIQRQQQDGSWRFCFENGTIIDAHTIILLRTLDIRDETLIRQLHARLLAAQQPEGCWKLYPDEEGNFSASIEAYYALLYSGYSQKTDEPLARARRWIQAKSGHQQVTNILTRSMLAATGQCKWPNALTSIPLEFILLPASSPVHLFDFSGYSRVHLVPMLIMADRNFSIKTADTPDLDDLNIHRPDADESYSRAFKALLDYVQSGLNKLIGAPHSLHEAATKKAEQFMKQRIESDGTLYSYASCTLLMVFSFLALGYDKRHPLILNAVKGLTAMRCSSGSTATIQNSPSNVWDTALLAYALQEAGVAGNHASIRKAADYLLVNQHRKLGDWTFHNPNPVAGGWGFSETNTIYPDVDDTTAALRAIKSLSRASPSSREAWNRGLNWVLSMQNKDGGWPAFEKDINKTMLTWIAIDGAKSAAIDPSEADLTGRTLELLGNFAGFNTRHAFIRRGADWLIGHQEKDGCWYGRWGICYIYGTWAALTGLEAVGLQTDHDALQKGARWLLSIQNSDGGWGESCRSDRLMRYVPLGESTPSQTAWALDALIAVHSLPTAEMDKGVYRLIASLHENGPITDYPTGAGLPGHFYVHYHSYRYIFPLLALVHYRNKYGSQ